MKRIPVEYAVLAIAVAATLAVTLPARAQTPKKSAETTADKVARGKYLVTTSGCHDCHTPWIMGEKGPEPDMSRMLSGHPESEKLPPPPAAQGPWIMTASATNTAWSGPWGVSYTANLTPDKETGLGKWTQRNFTETIRTGRHMGRGREILPPMPIQVYKNFTDADLASIFSYLQSIPAVSNRVPEPLPSALPVAAK
ncbi:MAG TPA: diheme cytochrome c-553 [Burkholderiaceae bacterium]|nr:diheme cytochrome c-553 [Burkholderiaceae bacterium]